MSLENYSSLIELAAGLNIALVIVEKARTYTSILAKRIFFIHDHVNCRLNESFVFLEEVNSLNEIDSLVINGTDMMVSVEKCKREAEILRDDINSIRNNIFENINERCEFRCFSGLCLFYFLYCVSMLFSIGLTHPESGNPIQNSIADYSVFFLGILSFLYFVVSHVFIVIKGENILHVSNLAKVVLYYCGALALSIILAFLLKDTFDLANITAYYVPAFVLIPMLSFISFFFLVKRKSINIKKDIDRDTSGIIESCKTWHDDANRLITSHRTPDSLSH